MITLTEIGDTKEMREPLTKAIELYGCTAEQGLEEFLNFKDTDSNNITWISPDGYCIMSRLYFGDGYWSLYGEPLAPEDKRGELVASFCDQIFSKSTTTVARIEVSDNTRRQFLKLIPPNLKSKNIAETLIWPVLDLSKYDPSYPGHEYKELRNIKNRFYREHSVEIRDASTFDKDDLHKLIDTWEKNRTPSHHSYPEDYHAAVDNNFVGLLGGHVLVADGKPQSISASRIIPNSSGGIYLAISLHTYLLWGLGEVTIMSELSWLKDQGFKYVDLGGSDKKMLSFKKKFGEFTTYKTRVFYVRRKA